MPKSVIRFFQACGRKGGSIGGLSKSPAKLKACALNAKLGGRPRKHPLPESALLAVHKTKLDKASPAKITMPQSEILNFVTRRRDAQ